MTQFRPARPVTSIPTQASSLTANVIAAIVDLRAGRFLSSTIVRVDFNEVESMQKWTAAPVTNGVILGPSIQRAGIVITIFTKANSQSPVAPATLRTVGTRASCLIMPWRVNTRLSESIRTSPAANAI